MSPSASVCPPRPQVYRPRQPQTTTLYQIVSDHGKRLEAAWELHLVFRERVFNLLLKEQAIDLDVVFEHANLDPLAGSERL